MIIIFMLQKSEKIKHSSFKKRKISPLALLTQTKKSQYSFLKEPILNFANPSSKPNYRYLKQNSEEKEIPHNSYIEKLDKLCKPAVKRSSKNLRFHSLQKNSSNSLMKSPLQQSHQSTSKARYLKTEQKKPSQEQILNQIRNRISKCQTQVKKVEVQVKRVVVTGKGGDQRLWNHFGNLHTISKVLQKDKGKEIIATIQAYVLDENADVMELQCFYACPNAQKTVRRLLFFERLCLILLVDLVITNKFRIAEGGIKQIINLMIQFYGSVYRDAIMQNTLNEEMLPPLKKQAKQYLIECEKMPNGKPLDFYVELIASKTKNSLKFSRALQHFYKMHHKYIVQLSANLSYFRLLEYYAFALLGVEWSNWRIEFLETCPSPYLHEEQQKKYTLVLDLDETLIHFKADNNFQGQFLIRPYLYDFLAALEPYYELGIFTCSLPEYADIIIDHMKQIKFRLYRHHTVRISGEYVKDLSRIGRNLSTLLMIDNIERNYRLQPDNGILIRSWYGDKKDTMLKQISKMLIELAKSEPEDIRRSDFIRSFN